MSNCVAFPLCVILTLILTHCYSLLAILDKKVLYVEDEPRRNYRLEDFLWTGSGDGDPEPSSVWRTTTVFRTTTTTVVLGSTAIVRATVHRRPPEGSCTGVGCGISATPTMAREPSTVSVVPPWPPPQTPPPEQRYWLVTVLRANVSKEDLQQLHHLGVNGGGGNYQSNMAAAIKRRREDRPLTVTVLNATATSADATLRLVYAVSVNGRPVAATAAAQDMRLLSDREVTAELGFPVLLKAEPYLQGPAEPFHTNLSRKSSLHHETWLLISAGVCALLLLLILVVLTVLGVSSRTRKRQRIDGSANREQVYRQEQHQRRSKVKVKGHDTSAGQENMAYQHDDNEQGKAVNPDSPGRLSLRSGPSSAASLVRRSAQNAPTPHPRPRPRSRKASPNSFLSMPSVKQFPRGPPVAEPLEQVLQPEIISEHHQRHVDDPGCSEQRGDAATRRHPHPPSDLPLTRHRSQNEGEDPGVIGPLVWDLHCHRMHKQECLEAEEEFEPNVGRMRRRFQELLDDAFSLFGSRSGSPEPQDSPTRQPHHDFRAKSAALVRPVSELLGTETILARPKTSASAISQRPSTAGNRSPKGAWSSSSLVAPGTPSLRPPPRPLSAGPFHRPSLEPSHILSDANLSPSDPAVPLIAAIQEELDKFAPPLPGSPPGPYRL
ncbi:hypothetical protein LSTR_LSTR008026 [Laodelphax striatellus]|uniref:Uncharacterized protein n=1 Tax=Laodelphax striatellus TaxID=195883 RepID=A0A482WJQ9_LAOST|nr:hypothetical protein LSTR_LSTR008026 [Laodelphax striatellus]